MIELGKYNDLLIIRRDTDGLYLTDGSGEGVILPNKYCSEDLEVEDEIRVFVHHDNDGKKVATTLKPEFTVGELTFLQVKAVAENIGAFMAWGVDKDLMIPFREQKEKMEAERWYIVYLDIDTETDRLYGSSKLEKFISNEELSVKEKDEVDVLIWKKTDMGYSVIINNKHAGLVFDNEIFKEIKIGDKVKGYVKNIREDHKIDVSLQALGYEKFNDINMEGVYNTLVKNHGFLAITDKSSPSEIYAKFGMSKKAFKKAIGALYKQRKIEIKPVGIKLL